MILETPWKLKQVSRTTHLHLLYVFIALHLIIINISFIITMALICLLSLQVCTENDPTIQFMGALEQLKKSLPSLWIPIITQNGLNIIKVSDGQDAVTQRSVGISASGEVKYFVHGKEVPTSHEVYSDNYGNVKVSNVDEIIASVSAVVAHFRKFDVCCGVPHPKYKMFWKSTRDSVVDKNPFKEMRYCETLRSESCLLVVNQQKRMCSICFSLSKRLCSRKKNFQKNTSPSTGKIRTPSKFKPWKTLITPEKKARQEKCQKIIEGLSRENARLKAKLANLIDTEGIKMKNSKQSNEFKDLIEEAKKTTTDPLHRLFLEQQLHALSLSDRHSMKWHPMMIRLALRIKMISSAAYNELASSGFVVLPSERTLYDYSHVMDLKDGIHKPIISEVAKQVGELKEDYQRYHTLLFDEVYISQNLVHKKSTGEIIGYTKLSEVQQEILDLERAIKETAEETTVPPPTSPPLVKRILSFMVKGVSSSVKAVVASYGVASLTKEDLMDYTWDVIEACECKDIRIVAVVCDGSPINRSFIDMHPPVTKLESGVVFDTVNVYSPERNIYFFSDLPHLAKTARNCLYNSGRKGCRKMFKNGEFITWDPIVRLFNEKKNETVTKLHKLSAGCVYLNSYSRMNVAFAMRVLSASVSNLLKQKKWEGCNELPIFAEV